MDDPESHKRSESLFSRASASVLGGISKARDYLNPTPMITKARDYLNPTTTITKASEILEDQKNEQLDKQLAQLHKINAKIRRLSNSGNRFIGPMLGRRIDKKRQQEIRELYDTAKDILNQDRFKILALTMSPTYLADYAYKLASGKHYIGEGGKKKGKSRKSSKTRKNRKTRSRK
jgi:hypothetical protein